MGCTSPDFFLRVTFGNGFSQVVETVVGGLVTHVTTLLTNLHDRFGKPKNVPHLLRWTTEALSIRKILCCNPETAPVNLPDLFSASKGFGIYDDPNLEYNTFRTEYELFTAFVQRNKLEIESRAKAEQNGEDSFYFDLLAKHERMFPNILRLFAASAVRSCAESIVESKFRQ